MNELKVLLSDLNYIGKQYVIIVMYSTYGSKHTDIHKECFF